MGRKVAQIGVPEEDEPNTAGETPDEPRELARQKEPEVTAEHRWPAVVALLIALALYASLPSSLFPVFRYVVVALGLILLVPVIIMNPVRFTRETEWSRRISICQTILLLVANLTALGGLIILLVQPTPGDGPKLILAALQVWLTNVISFALMYWEIDRGGPVARSVEPRTFLPPADFRFPQDEDHDAIVEVASRSSGHVNWRPTYGDYLYMSSTNSMAFSPTDTMPLSLRAKGLMGLEAFAGFILLALVIARAVSLLG
jgi:hypothetical protein